MKKEPKNHYKCSDKGYIYLMQSQSNPNEIKIGFSNNPQRRVKDLYRTNTAYPLLLRASWQVSHMMLAEKNIHRLFKEHRINNRREFFYIDPTYDPLVDTLINTETHLDIIIEQIEDGLYYLTTVCSNFTYH